MRIKTLIRKRISEELASAVTHGFGFVLSVLGFLALVVAARAAGDRWKVVSSSIYGASLILLYAASTLYHSVHVPRWRHVLRVVDHAAIYLLIAGTYTPFALVSMREDRGWLLFALVWGLALTGVGFKLLYTGRFEIFSTITYLALGWSALLLLQPILAQVPEGAIVWLLLGGMAYTVGVAFFAWERAPYNHAAWHVFVLLGSTCHYLAVMFYVLPPA